MSSMQHDKQTLLRQHRRRKRLLLALTLPVLIALVILGFAWWLPPLLLLAWVANEAWFSDHLFYSPRQDYQYEFSDARQRQRVQIKNGRLQLSQPLDPEAQTWLLAAQLRSSVFGRWLDPRVRIRANATRDQQTFERGVVGLRYLNLSDFAEAMADGSLVLKGQYCRLAEHAELIGFAHPDFRQLRTLIIAPHADDAELAAFGYYQSGADIHIATVTVGELEAEDYQAYGLSRADAAALKARLRSWDSLAIPQWAGLPAKRCWQLGYFCLQLPAMQQQPAQAFGSRVAPMADPRPYRQHNPHPLPADQDGVPNWRNLVADLRALLDLLQPVVVITPHPTLDPHGDHVACTAALNEAIHQTLWRPQYLLHYANHLHDNDRWPMGNAHDGVAPAPAAQTLSVQSLYSLPLTAAQQLDKAMALRMQHDLQSALPLKKRLRRCLQHWLVGRRWPAYGDSEFFRKAVRRHELFIVQTVSDRPTHI